MNQTLTINSLDFDLSYMDVSESKRQNSDRGINTPDVLYIRHQDATDKKYNTSMRRHNVRLDSIFETAEGVPHRISAYLVLEVASIASDTDINATVATFKAAVADADLLADVLNNES